MFLSQLGDTVIFICEASLEQGIGHAMRCLTLAKGLQEEGYECYFYISDKTFEHAPFLSDQKIIFSEKEPLPPCVLCVIDSYNLEASDHKKIKEQVQNIMVIDDLANRNYFCDILLDQTYKRSKQEYQNLVPEHCEILTGANFSLLKPAFSELREKSLKRREKLKKVKTVIISLGGTDHNNITSIVLEALEAVTEKLNLHIIISEKSNHRVKIEDRVHKLKKIGHNPHLYFNVKNIEDLMADADLAIGASGTTSWERCCLGLPSIIIESADNQKMTANELHMSGAAYNMGNYREVNSQKISDVVNNLICVQDKLHSMSLKALEIVDGKGLQRVISYLIKVNLRAACAQDLETLYEWQKYKGTRQFARNPSVPTFQEHCKWFESSLINKNKNVYMITRGIKDLGVITLDWYDSKRDECEVSLVINPEYYGQGIAKAGLEVAHALHKDAIFWAEILPENKASQAVFQKMKYKNIKMNWYKHDPKQNI